MLLSFDQMVSRDLLFFFRISVWRDTKLRHSVSRHRLRNDTWWDSGTRCAVAEAPERP